MNTKYFIWILLFLISIKIFAQIDSDIVSIDKCDFSTDKSVFGPSILQNELFFLTNKNGPSKYIYSNTDFLKLVKTKLDDSGIILENKIVPSNFNSEYHLGTFAYCERTHELFLTKSNWGNAKKISKLIHIRDVKLGISIFNLIDGNWKEVREFPFNSSSYSVANPTINDTGDTLIFTSDMPGGKGANDLYYSVKKNGKWSKPINLGDRVNTKQNENSPFLNKDGKLFFSSDGHKGLGKLDMYYTDFPIKRNCKIHHLPGLFNSTEDDFGLIMHPQQNIAYFSSNRSSLGNKGTDNLYLATFDRATIDIHTISSNTGKILPESVVTVSDKNSGDVLIKNHTNEFGFISISLKNDKNYVIKVEKDRYKSETEEFNFSVVKIFDNISKIIQLDTIFKIDEVETRKELSQVEAAIKKEMDDYVTDMQNQRFISDNVICDVSIEMIKEGDIPSLRAIFSYDLINDTLKFQYDDYSMGHYRAEESNAVMVTLSVMKSSVEGRLNKYILENKNITINITGSADAIPVKNTIPYLGEYGSIVSEPCEIMNTQRLITISEKSGIKNNEELAFIRSYVVRDYIEKNIESLKKSNIAYNHKARVSEFKGGRYRRIKIELIIHNAFENMQ